MGCKATETASNTSNIFGPGTANERTVQWWFKKFCKGNKSLEDEERSGQPLELLPWSEQARCAQRTSDNNQLRAIIRADPLTTSEKLLNNSVSIIPWSFSIWSKLVRWKSSLSGCLMCWPEIFFFFYAFLEPKHLFFFLSFFFFL